MTENLDYHKTYALLDAGWTDISAYVVSSIKGFWGINGNEVTDRVATTGEMTFELNNDGGLFTPDMPETLLGWKIGVQIKFVVSYDGVEKTKFIGRASEIDIDTRPWGGQRVRVTVLDWMNIPSITNITLPTVLLEKTINDGVGALLPYAAFQPSEIQYADYGVVDTFPTIFDTVKDRTKMLSEFAKLANSEFGFIYLKHYGQYGEILVTEGRNSRTSNRSQVQVPVPTSLSENLELEDGSGFLELEDGINPLTLDELTELNFNNNFTSALVKNGSRVITNVTVNTYPRRVDTSLQVIYSITNPISLGNGETKTFRSYYIDPYGSKINGTNLQTPVVTTDYLMYSNSDGTGTNLTANLTVVATYGSEAVDYTITNTGGTIGYVTKLQARGYGIYTFNTLTYSNESANLAIYGEQTKSVDMKYQDDIAVAEFIGDKMLTNYGESANSLESITTLANIDTELMMAFVYMDIGDLVGASVAKAGISGLFFVQSIKFEVTVGGLVTFTVGLTDALSLSEFYWELEIPGKSELGLTTVVSA